MLIDKEVEVTLYQSNIGYYRKMGYGDIMPKYKDSHYKWKVKAGSTIKVKVEDLPRYSEVLIKFSCDYCGKDFNKTANNYFSTIEDDLPIKKDACQDCKNIKLQECNVILYGYKTPFCDKEINKQCQQIIKDKYGVDNVFQSEEIKEKSRQTCLQKYGVDNSMKSEEIRKKSRNTLYSNGTAPCSKQQIYIYDIVGGVLNYPNKSISIDIAFLEEKIAVEVDASGHNLNVKMGDISQEEFNKKEMKRNYVLFRNGWKIIRIISKRDYFPSKEIVLQMLGYAKEYLNNGHHYINFDIDQRLVITSQFAQLYDYGTLKRIRSDVKQTA